MLTSFRDLDWWSLHSLFVMVGLAIYVGGSHTLHQRRQPTAAITWVLTLIVIPYIALPLYLIFGTRKVVKRRPPPRAMMPAPDGSVEAGWRSRQLAAAMGLPISATYDNLIIHEDGSQALRALHQLIDEARHTLDVCTFILGNDSLGADIRERLVRRAKEGVRVRLLLDGVGAWLGGRPDLKPLIAAGVQTALFVPPLSSPLRGRTNLRNHRKMAIADASRLWCGGRNLAAEYFEGETRTLGNKEAWDDLTFDLHGALAEQALQRFNADWAFADGPAPPAPLLADARLQSGLIPEPLPAVPTAPRVQLIPSGPDQLDDTFYTLLVSGAFNAHQRILAVTPYFVPDSTVLMALCLAARRGVQLDLVLPAQSNHHLADLARHRALRELAAAGARIWLLPKMIHAKAVVIDDEVALVGSANLDGRSLFLNYELMVAFYHDADVRRFAGWMERRRDASTRYQAEQPGLAREIGEGLLLWIAFQL